jgi:broad specificity phosphatase PhoE
MKRSLYLVRHGTTPANLENRFAGRSPEPLHDDGIHQIEEVGRRLTDKRIAHIFSGPLPRTVQSAQILQRALRTPLTINDDLLEINIPHWDGRTKDDIRSRFGEEYPTWLASPDKFNLANCETLAMVQDRAIRAITRITDTEPAGNLVVVSHLIVLRCIILYFKNMELKDFRKIKIGNASIVCLAPDENGGWSLGMKTEQ